jgi:hypothetical protein
VYIISVGRNEILERKIILQTISECYQKRSIVFSNYRRTVAALCPSAYFLLETVIVNFLKCKMVRNMYCHNAKSLGNN